MWGNSGQGSDSWCAKYLRDKYGLLSRCPRLKLPRGIPWDYIHEATDDITLGNIGQYVYLLINDYPEFFLRVVDEWLEYVERDSEERRLEDARFGTVYQSRRRLQSQLNSRVKFEHMVKRALEDARKAVQELSLAEKGWYMYDEAGQFKAERDWAIRHEEVEADDLDEEWDMREISPSPAFRPPTPISKPSSPTKRTSDAGADIQSAKRCRTSAPLTPTPSSPSRSLVGSAYSNPRSPGVNSLPTFRSFTFRQSPTPQDHSMTPRPSLVVSSTSSRSNHIVTPSTPLTPTEFDLSELDLDLGSDLELTPEPVPIPEAIPVPELISDPEDTSWRPVPALPEDQQTVLVLPVNKLQHRFWDFDVKFHVQWELERRMAQETDVTWDDLLPSDFRVLGGNVISALPKVELLLEVARLRASQRTREQDNYPRISRLSVDSPEISSGSTPSDIAKRISVILNKPPTLLSDSSRRLCTEADREELSIRSQDGKGSYSDDPEWKYGGKLIYTVYVRPIEGPKKTKLNTVDSPAIHVYQSSAEMPTSAQPSEPATSSHRQRSMPDDTIRLPFTMELRPPSMTGKSFHLARKYGSRRILNFKFDKICDPMVRKEMFDLFAGRRFVLAGRAYRPWWTATDKDAVVAIEVNESIPGITDLPNVEPVGPIMPSYIELLKASNDLELKPGQAMAKWASRPQLLLSDTYPAVRFSPSDIDIIEDIVVTGLNGPATTEQTLTDGCGLMTETVARHIGLRLPSSHGRPTVVQMRLMGAKGLLVLMTPEQEELYPGKSVLLRKSMVKSLTTSLDPSRFILEVVRCGHNVLKTSVALPAEAIIALSARHVPNRTLVEKAKLALDVLRDQFDPKPSGTETDSEVRRRLSAMLYRTGGVGVERRKRDCAKKALSLRVAGLIHDEKDKPDMDQVTQDDTPSMNGQPVQGAEAAMMAVDAGFDPRYSAYTCNLLNRHVRHQIDNLTRDFKIPIQQSMSAYIIPDTQNALGPKEIYVAFSGEGPIDPITGCPISHLLGPVLAFRSPCKLPTDVQKYTAVYRPELRHLTDCIVMSASSIECRQSPASFLAGGDYDGDTATIIFDPALVHPFVQAEDHIAITPQGFEEENFEKELVKGDYFLDRLSGADEDTIIRNYQTFLLGAIMDGQLAGQYSVMHDNAVYVLGHDHPGTVRLARMFSIVLDARKSGLKVRAAVLTEDRRKYTGDLDWRAHKKGEVDMGGKRPLERGEGLPSFILDGLMSVIKKKSVNIMGHFLQEPSDENVSCVDYHHLSALYLAKIKQIEALDNDLLRRKMKLLEQHAKACYEIWELIRIDMVSTKHTIEELYRMKLEEQALPVGRRSVMNHSPVKRGVARPENIVKEANKRALAKVWHENLEVDDMSLLCVDGNELKRLMVSFSATIPKHKPKQVFPFDVDFPTTLALKAEKVGKALTFTEDAMMAKKPTWRLE